MAFLSATKLANIHYKYCIMLLWQSMFATDVLNITLWTKESTKDLINHSCLFAVFV